MNMSDKNVMTDEMLDIFEVSDVYSSKKKRKESKNFNDLLKLYKLDVKVSIPEKGDVISAKYVGLVNDQYLFSVNGYKDDIRVDNKASESKYLKNISEGDIADLIVIDINQDVFLIKGSIASLYESRAHANLKALKEGQPVTVLVKSLNPAGYDVDLIHGGVTLPGFMPNTLAGINKLHDQSSIIGKTFDVMIESFSEQEGTYIVSRRKYLQTLIPEAIKQLTNNQIYTGYVTGTTPFGVFVEFSISKDDPICLTGMIHKANVDPEWQDKLSSISPGYEIGFYIKEIIKDKIILTQILRETLWDTIRIGQLIDGVVRDVKQFGTLVNLDDETVGLIHTSEMEKIGKRFAAEQRIKVKVLAVDRGSRKIFLTV